MTSILRTLVSQGGKGDLAAASLWRLSTGGVTGVPPGAQDAVYLLGGFNVTGTISVFAFNVYGYGTAPVINTARITAKAADFRGVETISNSTLTFRADPAQAPYTALLVGLADPGAIGTLTLSNTTAMVDSGSPTRAAIGLGVGNNGALVLDHGSRLTASGGVALGVLSTSTSEFSVGLLFVRNGSSLSITNAAGAGILAGYDAGRGGIVEVTGAGSSLSADDGIVVGNRGFATLTVGVGGAVTTSRMGVGVSGVVVVDGGTLTVASSLDQAGTLGVSNGGVLRVDALQAGPDTSIASGTIEVAGALTITGRFLASNPGAHLSFGSLVLASTGLLDIRNGPALNLVDFTSQGRLLCSGGTIAGRLDIGGLQVDGGSLTTGTARNDPLRATGLISGSGTVIAAGGLILDGADTNARIRAGSANTPVGLTMLGDASMVSGSIDVTGAAWLRGIGQIVDVTIQGGAGDPLLVVGKAAGDAASYSAGGTVTVRGDVMVGQGGTGNLDVTGALRAQTISVGDGSAGRVALATGASADVASLLVGAGAGGGTVAVGPGFIPTPTVLTVHNGIALGIGSKGALTVAGSTATVDVAPGILAPALTLGVGKGVIGRARISGGTLTAHGLALVGYRGVGQVQLATGGVLSADQVVVGSTAAGVGQIVLNGGGALLSTGTLTVGSDQGRGSLQVLARGAVRVDGNTRVHGAVTLNRGTLTGTGTLTIDRGYAISGSGVIWEGAVVAQGRIVATTKQMVCLGPISGGGTLAVDSGAEFLIGSEAKTLRNSFGTGGGTFTALRADLLQGVFQQWAPGDAIHLTQQVFNAWSVAGGRLVLDGPSGAASLGFAGTLSAADFVLKSDGQGGTVISHG